MQVLLKEKNTELEFGNLYGKISPYGTYDMTTCSLGFMSSTL